MLRSLASGFVAASALCAAGFAQQLIDPSRLRPITVPIRDAGVFDWSTKQWVSGPQATKLLASQYPVYRNDCTWPGGSFHIGIEPCETWSIPGACRARTRRRARSQAWTRAACTSSRA